MTEGSLSYELTNDNKLYSTWQNWVNNTVSAKQAFSGWLKEYLSTLNNTEREAVLDSLRKQLSEALDKASNEPNNDKNKAITISLAIADNVTPPDVDTGEIEDFIIYAPENSALRVFEREGQIEPLGINGEGLLKLLRVMSGAKDKTAINSIKESLALFSWFKDIKATKGRSRDRIEIFDQFLDKTNPSFDQRSANEGFLFLAFYLALFTSEHTPRFFAVDNVDTSLNPKLCEALMRRLAALAKVHGKQVLLTTHNPAILDGLDLGDPEHRLFVVSRGPGGQTRVRRFETKPSSDKPRRLSELFLSGALGGLPKGF